MTHHLSGVQQRALLMAGVRAIVVLVQLVWLLDVATSGPLGPVAAGWMFVSVAVIAAVARRREPWARAEVMVAGVDVATVVAVTLTAPAGALSVGLLALVVLVQVTLRWGAVPAIVVGALLSAVAVINPLPPPVRPGVGEPVLALVTTTVVVVIAMITRTARGRQQVLGQRATATSALTFEHSPVGAAVTDATGKLREVNPTLARWCASTPQALAGRDLRDMVHPGDAGALAAAFDPAHEPGPGAEVRLLTAQGTHWVRLLIAHVPPADPQPGLCVVQIEDAAEQRATRARLNHDALHDTLTGLPNRRAVTGALAALLAAPGRGGALLMIDLDDFKAVNDRLGHDAGDEMLQVVAHRLVSCLRPSDVAGRLGGDELVVIARGVGDDVAAEALGHRVLSALVGPASLRAGAVAVRASIGLRRVTGADHDALALARDADAALYRAKSAGGCRVRRAEIGEGEAALSAALLAPMPASTPST